MGKKFACSNMGVVCGFEAKANSEREVMKKIARHYQERHDIHDVNSELELRIRYVIEDA